MEKVVADYVSGLTLGEPQVYKNLAAIPPHGENATVASARRIFTRLISHPV